MFSLTVFALNLDLLYLSPFAEGTIPIFSKPSQKTMYMKAMLTSGDQVSIFLQANGALFSLFFIKVSQSCVATLIR
jgi:hypothetical protein